MSIYLTSRSIPELASGPESRREEIWQRCHSKAWRHWQTRVAFAASLLCYAAGFWLGVFKQPEGAFSVAQLLGGLGLVVLGTGGFFPVHAAMTRRYIRQELERG